jgi:hypothetical protein
VGEKHHNDISVLMKVMLSINNFYLFTAVQLLKQNKVLREDA